MEVLLPIAIAVIAGLLMTRVVKPLGLPAVTAYLVLGVLIGPYCLGRLGIPGLGFTSMEAVEQMSVISQVALGFIAFSIGSEFRLSELKKTGRQAVIVGVIQGLVAALFVDIALIVLHLILGPEKLPLTVSKSRVKSASAGRHRVTEPDTVSTSRAFGASSAVRLTEPLVVFTSKSPTSGTVSSTLPETVSAFHSRSAAVSSAFTEPEVVSTMAR